MCDENTNVVEPLLTHQETMMASVLGAIGTPDSRRALWRVGAWVCLHAVLVVLRCIGGVSSS